jgi:hypothetical protein
MPAAVWSDRHSAAAHTVVKAAGHHHIHRQYQLDTVLLS